MIKFFRTIRQSLIMENKTSKYFKYAIGEIVLVVIGILIALQINNANQERIEKNALEGYLKSIANNVESDLRKVETINSKRISLLPKITSVKTVLNPRYIDRWITQNRSETIDYIAYNIENVSLASQTIKSIWDLDYLNANLSGFESLKNSGYLSKLQGKDIENLLLNYYNLINEITIEENNYNASLLNSSKEFLKVDLPGRYGFFNPGQMTWSDEFKKEFPKQIAQIIEHPSLFPTLTLPNNLITKYENLSVLGKELIKMIKTKRKDYNRDILDNLEGIYDEYSDYGYSKIFRNGSFTGFYETALASSNGGDIIAYYNTGEYVIVFNEQDWGVFFFYNGSGAVDNTRTTDFSKYKTLRLELKGEKGGEKVLIALKDETNPEDGSETKVPLTLSNGWKNYDIPLASFAPTNLKKLFMVTGFIFEKDPCTIRVRNIEVLR